MIDVWSNFMRPGDANPIHIHQNCDWSSVLYIDIPAKLRKEQDAWIQLQKEGMVTDEQLANELNRINDELLALNVLYNEAGSTFEDFNIEGLNMILWLENADIALGKLKESMKITQEETEKGTEAIEDQTEARKKYTEVILGDASVAEKIYEEERERIKKLEARFIIGENGNFFTCAVPISVKIFFLMAGVSKLNLSIKYLN